MQSARTVTLPWLLYKGCLWKSLETLHDNNLHQVLIFWWPRLSFSVTPTWGRSKSKLYFNVKFWSTFCSVTWYVDKIMHKILSMTNTYLREITSVCVWTWQKCVFSWHSFVTSLKFCMMTTSIYSLKFTGKFGEKKREKEEECDIFQVGMWYNCVFSLLILFAIASVLIFMMFDYCTT